MKGRYTLKKSEGCILWADAAGNIQEEPRYTAVGRTGHDVRAIRADELSPMPEGTVLHLLPDRMPRGRMGPKVETLRRRAKAPALAVAAMLPNGWARTLLPAYERAEGAQPLPFFGYTAVAWLNDQIHVAAVQTEFNIRWSAFQYGTPDLGRLVKSRLKASPGNRLLYHHAHCALDYGCYNAENLFYERWEGAIAVSAACNAKCVGCISLQPEDMPKSPHDRLDFVPSVEEIVEIGVPHLERPEAILSFGQGCEGEPLLKADLIARSIREMRRQTASGTIHINTNASLPKQVQKLIDAGLDSIRVSLNSVDPARYTPYYKPQGYAFQEVEETVRLAREGGLQIALNLLYFPGLNDLEDDLARLEDFIGRHRVDQVQMRNLNIDPDLYLSEQPPLQGRAVGIPSMVKRLRRICDVGNSTCPIVKA